MKRIIFLLVAVLITTGAFAQKSTKPAKPAGIKSGIYKKGNTVWVVKPMQQAETMDNGLKITPSGNIRTASGKTGTLNDEDCISPEGKVVGLNQKELTTAYLKHGKMWVATRLDKPLTLNDGESVLPDGTMKKKDGSVIHLKNNEIVDITNKE